MKHIFIINPIAGKGRYTDMIEKRVRSVADASGVSYEIIKTNFQGEATKLVKKYAASATDVCRFYACGGDGTLNEVVNGVVGCENAECALLPVGTGNDFSRNFTSPENFLDINKQLVGKAVTIDTIICNGRHSINMINIGFDCDVVAKTEWLKEHSPIKGSLAYMAGVAVTLANHYGIEMEITFPDGTVKTGTYLLSAFGNGGYCGGGFHSHPIVSLDDGLMDLCLIDKVSRLTFISLLSSYKAGKHLDNPRAKNIIHYGKYNRLSYKFKENVGICYDGEVVYADHADFCMAPGSVRFSIPEGSAVIPPLTHGKTDN